jgi:hypothetical protein
MAEISGKLLNFRVRENGTLDAFRTLVCTDSVSFSISTEVNTRATNCGPKTSAADPTFSATGNAVFDGSPGGTEVSWSDVKEWMKTGTKLDFQFYNAADVANGIVESALVDVDGSGYFSESELSGVPDDLAEFSWTFTGTGTLDEFDES